MAIGIENYPNITAPDSDYQSGRIKDDTGVNDGTPIDLLTSGDIHEFFAKLMRQAAITPNNVPDNEYSGHQYMAALINAINTNSSNGVIETSASAVIKTKVINIGDWNIPSNANKLVAHGLNYRKILNVRAIIRDDLDLTYNQLDNLIFIPSAGSIYAAGSIGFDATNIALRAITQANATNLFGGTVTSWIDDTNHDATSYNRGWITITYQV